MYVRGTVARGGGALADRLERTDLSANRGDPRRSHQLFAGDPRRLAQLGLSILLVARCNFHALVLSPLWLHGGSCGMAGLAAARCRHGRSGYTTGLWDRGRAAIARAPRA